MPRRMLLPLALLVMWTWITLASPVAAAPGDLDTSFSENGVAKVFTRGSVGTGVAVDAHGRVVVAGYTLDGEVDVAVARFHRDGSLDPAFGGDGRVRLDLGGADYAFDVALVPGGGMVVTGSRTTADTDLAFVLRLGGRGRPLPSFGDGGLQTVSFGKRYQAGNAIAVTPAGRYVVGGWVSNGATSRSAFVRLLADGSLDAAFSGDGRAIFNLSEGAEQVRDVLVLDSGRILGAGDAEVGTNARFALLRVRVDGTLDTGFGRAAGVTLTDLAPGADSANAIARRTDGSIVLAGAAGGGWGMARYAGGGTPDGSFGTAGEVVIDVAEGPEAAQDIIPVGARVLLVGSIRGAGSLDLAVVRLKDSGAFDGSFSGDGVVLIDLIGSNDGGRAGALTPGGRLLVVGETWVDGLPRILVVGVLT